MVEDPLRDIVDGVRARLQDELETQLRGVAERHHQALLAAQQRIEAEADERCAARIEALTAELRTVKAEYEEHVRTAVGAVRAEMEQQAAEQADRVRAEMEQQAAEQADRVRAEMEQQATEQAARVRAEMEQALANERLLAEARLEAERANAATQRQHAVEALEAERAEWQSRPVAGTRVQDGPTARVDSLVRGLAAIDAATSVSSSLGAIARAAAAEAPRAALFIVNGAQLDEWPVTGLPSLSGGPLNLRDPDAGLVVKAANQRRAVRNDGSACAAPLVLDGAAVAVLYGEADADGSARTAWSDNLEAVARFGAAHLGCLTALRTAQARQWLAATPGSASGHGATDAQTDEEASASARRYARLVVSEIKLYNESAVQAGRSRRDLLERLQPEIDRARRLYDERVPASVAGRGQYFQQELVQILAGGDPSLLG